MSWRTAFEAQWSTFLDTVEARLRRELVVRGRLGAADANAILAAEVATWTRSGHYNAAWLSTMSRQSPMLGASFHLTLEEIGLTRDVVPAPALPLGSVATTIASTLGVAGLLAWQQADLLQILLTAGVAALAAVPVVVAAWALQRERALRAALNEVRMALEPTGQALREITIMADRPSSGGARPALRARPLAPEMTLVGADCCATPTEPPPSPVQTATPLRDLGCELRGAALSLRVGVA